MNYFTKITLLGLFLLTSNAFAQDDADEEKKLGWSGSGEAGLVNTTGNTESLALNFKAEVIRTTDRWRHRLFGTVLNTSENGITDNKRYTAELQSDRKLTEKGYLFAVYRYDADRFGAYDPSQTLTAGYGNQLMKSEKHALKGEIGAGYRNLKDRISRESEGEFIMRFVLDDNWQVWKTTNWSNRLLVETGSNNTFSQFDTALAVSMTEKFAVKIGFQVRNNSKLPPGDSEHTDTVTTVNLVYGF